MTRRTVETLGKSIMLAVTLALLGSLCWLLVAGDGHEPPPLGPWGYDAVHVCPSAAWALEPLREASTRYEEVGVPILPIEPDDCADAPMGGVAQVRAHTDVVAGLVAPVDGPYVDRIAHGERRAVAYVLSRGEVLACTPGHVLGHLLGYREHATAATSVMADPCGSAYHHLRREQ